MRTRFLFALIIFALPGINRPSSAASVGAVKQSGAAQQKTPGDAQIEHNIKAKLAKSKLNADHFTVSVTKGVATIEGSTNVMQHKGTMTRIAKLSGATAVRNNIRISDSAKAKAVAALSRHRATSHVGAAAASTPLALAPGTASIPRATVLPMGGQR